MGDKSEKVLGKDNRGQKPKKKDQGRLLNMAMSGFIASRNITIPDSDHIPCLQRRYHEF
jgi:hypothetical protein